MEKKNLDWGNIGFSYVTTDYRYVSNYKDGKWDEGTLTEDPNVVINECAGILQYCQECFEGLKAYTTEDGSIVTFRPDLNAERMMDSCARLEMPQFPKKWFLSVPVPKKPPFFLLMARSALHFSKEQLILPQVPEKYFFSSLFLSFC